MLLWDGDIWLTMDVYTHVDEKEQAAGIARLPGLVDLESKRVAG